MIIFWFSSVLTTSIPWSTDRSGRFPGGQFMAAWGEPMCLEPGDYLASGPRGEDGSVKEIIRIERTLGTFFGKEV